MFTLTIWDGVIVAAYVVFCLSVAFALKRRGERHGLVAPQPKVQVAVLRGCDVDQPRNLAKSVTVE